MPLLTPHHPVGSSLNLYRGSIPESCPLDWQWDQTIIIYKRRDLRFHPLTRYSLPLYRDPSMADSNGSAVDTKSRFVEIYARLKSEILEDPALDYTDDSRQWIDRMLDYNVPGGKLNRGISVVDSYKLLKEGSQLTDDEFFLSSVLGWCIEWLQAYFLVVDDIMDNSHTRRGQPCWFRLPKVG
ncbi:farnesyl pyrophosphate synthase 1-like [Asparagus officinalis]|uniref:farnesyl pyrophosphate synthase 1-like n=1 Tax=Asparagus officinalis TaxID=4686 RepID=UPI00098E76F1|nr:farnesyl pyrophosphate synthase 1-like [Asparagus officinalis]